MPQFHKNGTETRADRKNVMSIVRVFNESKQVPVADRVTLTDTSQTRRTGLLKHESLPKGEVSRPAHSSIRP